MRALRAFPLGLDPAIPILLSLVGEGMGGPDVHEPALVTLRVAWPTPAVVPALIEALTSGQQEVRSVAAFLLGRIGPGAVCAVPDLKRVLNEPRDSAVRGASQNGVWENPPSAAAQALGEISSTDDVIAALAAVLGPESSDRRHAAARALGDMRDAARAAAPAVVAAYSKWLDSTDSNDGTGYALALGIERLAPQSPVEADAVGALVRGLESPNEWTIEYAAKALGKFGKAAASAAPRLRVLKEKAVSAQARAAAASSLDAIEGAVVSRPEAN
jgi:HEAT repeat protein